MHRCVREVMVAIMADSVIQLIYERLQQLTTKTNTTTIQFL